MDGSLRWRMREFARFLDNSIKSANETEYHVLASHDLALIADEEWERYTTETIEVRKMIYVYRVAIPRDEGGPAHPVRDAGGPEHAARAADGRPHN